MALIDHFVELLNDRIKAGLPGVVAHRIMAPSSRPLKDFREQDYPNAKRAAVLILFYPVGDEIHIVLIKRPDYEGVHSGQISFPGGRIEADESPLEAALREAKEEVGVSEEEIKVFNALSNVYIPPSNFFVFPFLAYSETRPHFKPDQTEVESIIEMPIEILFEQSNKGTMEIDRGGEKFQAPYYEIQKHKVWGATAIFLSEIEFLLTGLQI